MLALAIVSGSGCGKLLSKLSDVVKPASTPEPPTTEVVVNGVDGAIADNIRAHLSLSAEPCDAPDWRVTRLLKRAGSETEQALRAFGYYAPEVKARFEDNDECWEVHIDVVPGEPVLVAAVSVQIEGQASFDPEFDDLLDALPLKEGEVLNHAQYEATKQALASLGAERGYLDGRFTEAELRVDVARRTAEAHLTYASGKRYRFGELKLTQDFLRPDLVERLAAFPEDEPYESNELVELNRRLTESGYFARVDVRPGLDTPEADRVPVDVSLTPRRRHEFTAGAGAATDTGPRARIGYENRRVNRRGHRVEAAAKASLIETGVSAEYRVPLKDPRTEWLSFQAGARIEDTDTSESETLKLGVRQTKSRLRGGWLETRFFDIQRETFTVGNQSNATSTLLVPGLSWLRTVANHPLRPTRGYRVNFEIKGTEEAIGSDTSFLRGLLTAEWVYGLPWDGRILLRGELGALAVTNFDALPPSQRFFTGGDTSIRGYTFESLGPTDDSGEVIGGKYLAVGSFEYEHPIRPNWSIAGFIDGGNAFDDSSSNEGIKVGVGLGVRWHSPVGPVRLDLAHPVDDNPLIRIHLRLGPDL